MPASFSPRSALALALWLSSTTCAAHANPSAAPTPEPERSASQSLVARVEVDPGSALALARAALDAGRSEEARARADEVLARGPDDALAWVAARAAEASGDRDTAIARFGDIAEGSGPLSTWAALERAELLRTVDPAAAALAASRLVDGFAGADRARRLEALSLLEAGRAEDALPKLRAELARLADRAPAAAVALPLAAHLASRDETSAREEALALYRRVATRAPLAEVGRRAASQAEAVRASLPQARRAALAELPDADRMAEAHARYEAMRHEEAAEAYRAIARATSSEAVRCEARLMEGSALERARKRGEAAPILADVAERCADPDVRAVALYRAGRSYQASGDREAATSRFLALPEALPEHRLADDGLFLAARVFEDQGEHARATALLERLVRELPGGDMRDEAVFRLAWTARKRGELDGALALLEPLADVARESGDLLGRARYWHARTLSELGRAPAAAAAYEALARSYPLSFYAQQGLARLRAIEPARVDAILAEMAGEGASADSGAGEGASFARAAALLSVGEVASAELELAHAGALDASARPEALLLAAKLLAAAGERTRAMRLVGAHDDHFRRSMPVGEALAYWRIAYPSAFEPLIEEAAAREAIPASFVRAVAREESAFDPSVVSHAHAYGLVQIILPTAREAARGLGLEASPRTLRDPETNLRLGTRFMARLFRRYEACPSLVPAAYNAGPGAVDRWIRGREGRAFDELVEDIPYDETRRYARKVLASYGVYTWLDAGRLPPYAERVP